MIKFIEDNEYNYASRTKKNIQLADATIDICIDPNTAGEKLTKKIALELKKPFLQIIINKQCSSQEWQRKEIFDFFDKISHIKNIKLNIAGNGIYTLSKYGITQEKADQFVYILIDKMLDTPIIIGEIRSGGQTGFDEAALKMAERYRIKAICLAPHGWRFRDVNNKDIQDKIAFISRFYPVKPVKYTDPQTTSSGNKKQVTMYTSYWFNKKIYGWKTDFGIQDYKCHNTFIVQISVSIPQNLWRKPDYNFPEVAPDWETLRKYKEELIDEAGYYAEYIRKLFNNKQAIAKKIVDIYHQAQGKEIVFCCWEAPHEFCHRHIFAKFANKQFRNLTIKEL